MDNQYLTLTQISLYNPQEQKDDVIEKLFVARHKQYEYLLNRLSKEKPKSIPQHHLIIAQRGMGKSTLLKRIEVELRTGKLSDRFIPILMPEELYDLRSLSRFFLRCLDRLADTCQQEDKAELVNKIDKKIEELSNSESIEDVARNAYKYLIEFSELTRRRVVLLVDNVAMVFNALQKEEQHLLRALLSKNKAPILIGANAKSFDATQDYQAPFYDAFQMHYLKKLKFEELKKIIRNLALITNTPIINNNLIAKSGRLKSLHQLTGGNPRTMTMLFRLLSKGFAVDIQDDLNAILDEVTPLYKDRFESLSDQMKRIVLAVAMHWDPIQTAKLRADSGLENKQLSPQLNRLLDSGWLMTEDQNKKKNKRYIISERLFNIWLLMRQGTRREKQSLHGLSRFLDLYYGNLLNTIAETRLGIQLDNINQINLNFAIANALPDGEHSKRLKFEGEFAKIQIKLNEERKEFEKLLIEKQYLKALNQLDQLIVRNNQRANYEAARGMILHKFLKKQEFAKKAYLNAIALDDSYAPAWFGLGILYREYYKDFKNAELAFLNTTKLDKSYSSAWSQLGIMYQTDLREYEKAKSAYEKVLEQNENDFSSWNNLAVLLVLNLGDYLNAKKACLKAIEINDSESSPLNILGIIYMDYYKDYKIAKEYFLKASEINDNDIQSKLNLAFLLRVKLNQPIIALDFFSQVSLEEAKNLNLGDSYFLCKSIFELYNDNLGIASENLNNAYSFINKSVPYLTQDDWYRFAAITFKLGFIDWLINLLESLDKVKTMIPYLEASKALKTENHEEHFMTIAVEKRQASREILEKMLQYLK